ncbi:MAG TPA: thioesterase family protein [Casimicrobiaceae bacterium]|jgi:fluoroacetyl-CoA thioesterase|nr:thioesterase family protein [Casimicrobiaceae bacterium]
MKDSLAPGLEHELRFVLSESKLVPALYPESPEFRAMPPVFATGYLVGFLEWACLLLAKPHLDWPREQTVGIHVDVSHEAATPAGLIVTARAKLVAVEGRRLSYTVEADDGVDLIARGTHQRAVILREKFDAAVAAKRQAGAVR